MDILKRLSLRGLEFITRLSIIKFVLFLVVSALVYYYISAFIEFEYINRYYTGIIVISIIMIIMAVSLNVATGFLGQLVLGHAGFMAIGAYVAGVFAVRYKAEFEDLQLLLLAIVLAMLTSAVAGLIVGFPALRLKGDYLGIMTLGFGEIVRVTVTNLKEYTGGGQGLPGIPRVTTFQISFIALVFTITIIVLLMKSRYGRAILSIRENEIASESVGINLTKYKLLGFVVAAAFGGLGGALFAFKDGYIAPTSFSFVKSVEIFVIVVLGGMGSITGSILAGLFVGFLPEVLRDFDDYRMLIYSLLLMLTMLFRPQGLLGTREFTFGFLNKKVNKVNKKYQDQLPQKDIVPFKERSKTADDEPILDVQNISITFGGLKAVEDFSVKIYNNELVGLIGPNGAGKTTIFNMITGVYTPTEGNIYLDSKLINGKKPSAIVQIGCSRTFQNIRLFGNMSVIDNIKIAYHNELSYGVLRSIFKIGFVAQERRAERVAMELLDVFNLGEFKDELAKNLPYGKQRKLEIARALATNPKILYLDEPAAGMNPQETEELMSTINLIKDRFDVSILLIEHDMKLVMGICERIVCIDYGKIIASGLPEEIRKDKNVIKAYLGE